MVGSPGTDSGAIDSGGAFLFDVDGGSLVQMGFLTPTTPQAGGGFGTAVGVTGSMIAVGSPGLDGGVSLFGTQNLALIQALLAGNGQTGFGSALSLDVLNLLIGAPSTNGLQGASVLKRDPDILYASDFEGN